MVWRTTTNWITFTFLVVALLLSFTDHHANCKIIKKSNHKEISMKDESTAAKKPSSTRMSVVAAAKKQQLKQPAIIAIEIVDPNDNSTGKDGGRGRKRTINSALGYGYQSFFDVQQKPPKFEIYKYSQHDIPAYKTSTLPLVHHHHPSSHHSHHHHGHHQHQSDFEIQKSIQYDLGSTRPEYIPHQHGGNGGNLQSYYQPGTTLFSTIDQHGHLGGLSKQLPHIAGMVPVIIFRIYTNQLSNPGALHANIPQNHPYANLNHVNLNRLLNQYVQMHAVPVAPQHPQQHAYHYQQQQQQVHQQQQHYHHEQDELPTHENYPDDAHTKVIFHKTQSQQHQPVVYHQHHSHGVTPKTPQKFKITVPANTFSQVEVQEHTYEQEEEQHPIPQPHAQYSNLDDGADHANKQQQYYYYQHQQQPQHYEQPQQYVQVHQQHQQQQYDYDEQEYQDTQDPNGYNDNPLQPEQIAENHNVELHKASADAGRDLHPKVYNYHPHEHGAAADSANDASTTHEKRRGGGGSVRVPLVLAPKLRDSIIEKKQHRGAA